MYEQALQAVNPQVTIPYWDFTVVCTVCGYNISRVISPGVVVYRFFILLVTVGYNLFVACGWQGVVMFYQQTM